MSGNGWVWLCTDGTASLYLGADKIVNETADGIVAIAPESKFLVFETTQRNSL